MSILFIGGMADGKWIAVPGKLHRYKIATTPRPSPLFETVQKEDLVCYHDSYILHWWFDKVPLYIEEHMTPEDALKRLAHYYRPESQDE
jgi:hypothetical protein